jgi:ferredoxin
LKTDEKAGTLKIPVVDIGQCNLCEGCIAVCPEVFQINDAGYLAVAEMEVYPEACVNEAIMYCPEDCIDWDEA